MFGLLVGTDVSGVTVAVPPSVVGTSTSPGCSVGSVEGCSGSAGVSGSVVSEPESLDSSSLVPGFVELLSPVLSPVDGVVGSTGTVGSVVEPVSVDGVVDPSSGITTSDEGSVDGVTCSVEGEVVPSEINSSA